MKIVIIIPTYNEKENIKKMIPMLEEEVFPQIEHHQMSILIADDHSPDGTGQQVEQMMKKWNNISLLEGKKEGLGGAYIRAMNYAMEHLNADAVVELDADFQHDPRDIPRLVEAMDKGADYVIGSRYIKGGQIPPEWAGYRKLMSFFGSMFARVVLLRPQIHDFTSGYKLTKTEYLRKVDLENIYSKYFAYKIHILHDVLKAGAKAKEVPIIFYERKEGSSKISQKDLYDSFLVVLRLRMRDSSRMLKFLFVGGSGFVIQLVAQEGSIAIGLAAAIAVAFHRFTPGDVKSLTDGIAAAIGAEIAILWNYTINNFWTFTDTRSVEGNSGFFGRLIKFNLTSLASIFIQFLAVFLAVLFLGQTVMIMGVKLPTRILVLFPAIILLVIPLNYLIYNKLIWKTHRLPSHGKTKK